MSNYKSQRSQARRQQFRKEAIRQIEDYTRGEQESLPSKWSGHSLSELEKGSKVVGMCRDSNPEQNLQLQIKTLKRILKGHGYPLNKMFAGVEKGWKLDPEGRPVLYRARGYALKYKLPLVVLDFTRLLRDKDDHTVRPSASKMAELVDVLKGVPFYSVNDVDTHPVAGETFLRREYAITEGKSVGRPTDKTNGWRARRREEYLPLAISLREEGKSLREIARIISIISKYPISAMGVKKWLD